MNRTLRDQDEIAPIDSREGEGIPLDAEAEAATTCPPVDTAEADLVRNSDRSWDISDWFAIS